MKGNANAVKTGETARPRRVEAFKAARDAAPVEPTAMLQEQARDTYARLQYMHELLLQTEQEMEDLAASGDGSALGALAVVEIARKQEPRTTGDGDKTSTVMTDVELSTKSRSLLDRWIAQHDAITRVGLLYARIAERLKPPRDIIPGLGVGTGSTTIIVNAGIPGVDYPANDGGEQV